MISAYNGEWLKNLNVLKEAKQWQKSKLITADQLAAIREHYPTSFFHPNLMIRILLFIASFIAVLGIAGLFFLFFADGGQEVFSTIAIMYAIASVFFLEKVFIQGARHYKSGVTEALLYQAIAFFISGVIGLTDFNEHVVVICCMVVFSFSAIRYHDLVCTIAAICAFVYFVFLELYQLGGVLQTLMPFAMMVLFLPVYFYILKLKSQRTLELWHDCLTVAEVLTLIILYASGNYFVVREMSIELMNWYLAPEEEIPFAFLFYFLTVLIPIVYLYFGVNQKNLVLLRVSLVVLAFSVFTFKYYYSTGYHEITFTLSGIILIVTSISLLRYLKVIRNGYTRENMLADKWANVNAEAFIISQTMGGNKHTPAEQPTQGGGGSFGGGGASGGF